jgi:hypothetical protein
MTKRNVLNDTKRFFYLGEMTKRNESGRNLTKRDLRLVLYGIEEVTGSNPVGSI